MLTTIFTQGDCFHRHSHASVMTMRHVFYRLADVLLFFRLVDCTQGAVSLETAASYAFQFKRWKRLLLIVSLNTWPLY